jgi:curved DNA-binding protein CbpA
MAPAPNPYKTLGVAPGVSDAELRAAYRRAVLRDHPDHNGGSAESTRRFEEVQEAYAQIRRVRERSPATAAGASGSAAGTGAKSDPGVEARIADMEQQLAADRAARERAAKAAREREQARRRAREAAQEAATDGKRPSDEELGYIKTDDSFSKIFSDAVSELSERLATPEHNVPKRLSDLIDELESKLGGEHSDR